MGFFRLLQPLVQPPEEREAHALLLRDLHGESGPALGRVHHTKHS